MFSAFHPCRLYPLPAGCTLVLTGYTLFLAGCTLFLTGCTLFLAGCTPFLTCCTLETHGPVTEHAAAYIYTAVPPSWSLWNVGLRHHSFQDIGIVHGCYKYNSVSAPSCALGNRQNGGIYMRISQLKSTNQSIIQQTNQSIDHYHRSITPGGRKRSHARGHNNKKEARVQAHVA